MRLSSSTARVPAAISIAILCAGIARGQSVTPDPHIGYIFPAGGKQASVFEVLIGGQFLRGVNGVHISGEGVTGKVIKFYRPPRNLQPEQRAKLGALLKQAKDKRLAKMKNWPEGKRFVLPGEKFGRMMMMMSAKKDEEARKKAEAAKNATLPDHPLLRDLEGKSLRELYIVANTFFNWKEFQKKQPNAQLAEMVLVEVMVSHKATPGDRELRLQTPLGLTNPMCFQVGCLQEISEQEPNNPGHKVPLPPLPPAKLPILINGQIMPGDVDRFSFKAKGGQQLVVKTHARRLIPYLADAVPGWFQATVTLYDAEGNEVAFADDYRFDPDPVLFFKIPKTGDYQLEIRDSIYRGREDFVYRISIGEIPFITQSFPLGGREGSEATAKIEGWNLKSKELKLDTRPGGGAIRQVALYKSRRQSNELAYAVDDLPEFTETEPNNNEKDAQFIRLPRTLNGCIESDGDVDVYCFVGREGAEIVAEVMARKLNSPLDSLLRVTEVTGKVLEWNDDYVHKEGHLHRGPGLVTHHADSYLRLKLPKDGQYLLHVADTQGHGGKAYCYRVRVGPPQPDFMLQVSPSTISTIGGRSVPITAYITRIDGHAGPVDIAMKNAPPGFFLSGATVPAGRDSITMTLTTPTQAPARPITLELTGRSKVGGETVTRPAFPSDNVMQAFLWRHLAPSREMVVGIARRRWSQPAPKLVGESPVKVPVGSPKLVQFRLPARKKRDFEFVAVGAPAGITITNGKSVVGGLSLEINAEGGKVEPGYADNLIVEVFTNYDAKIKNKQSGKTKTQKRRASLGFLPAIPYVVVQPKNEF